VSGERAEVREVRGEHDSIRFCRCNDERVDRRPAPGGKAQDRSPANEDRGDVLVHVARSKEPIHVGVAARVSGEALDEHGGGNERRPKALST
jgi:hypothetical protein